MKSWRSVVPELTFLNKPWKDLLLDPHSSRALMPERLPLPPDSESFNKKHIFYDMGHVQRFTHRVDRHSLSCQHVTCDPNSSPAPPHTLAFELSLNTFPQPLISSSCQIMEIKELAAKRDTRCANFRVNALSGLLTQASYTQLCLTCGDTWEAWAVLLMSYNSHLKAGESELQNAQHRTFFSNTVLFLLSSREHSK